MDTAAEERLFLDLMVFDNVPESRVAQLIEDGYIDTDRENTDKAESFIDAFVGHRAYAVIQTLEEQGSYFRDKGRVMFNAGVKSQIAMDMVMERLSAGAEVKKKRNGDYIKRNGINTP